jgi:hypothetical protein
MRSEVRFLFRVPTGMVAYETNNRFDLVCEHHGYASLRCAVTRPGMHILHIIQRGLEIKNVQSYEQIDENRALSVLYRRTNVSPLTYNGFQG